MPLQLPPNIEPNARDIVEFVSDESVDVYRFLSNRYIEHDPHTDRVYQFVFRSFYRLDNAGLTSDFKERFFELLSDARETNSVDIPAVVRSLFEHPNRQGQQSLQFSFASKLANSVDPGSPIYDREVAKVFVFRAPDKYRSFEKRLSEYMDFYDELKALYEKIIKENLLADTRKLFRDRYQCISADIPEVKVLDFIFWSAGKLGFVIGDA